MKTPKEFQEVQERYDALQREPFPMGHRSKMIGDKTLALVQSEIGGFVLTYTGTNGSLGSRQKVVLAKDLEELKKSLVEFTDEGKKYFQELIDIGELVYNSAHDQPSM